MRRGALLLGALLAAVPAAAQWMTAAPLPTARSGTAVGVLDGQIYVAGGRTASGYIVGTVERFDPAGGQWTAVASMDHELTNSAAVVVGGRLVVTGGRRDDGRVRDDAEVYDPVNNVWLPFAELSVEREGHAAFAVGDSAYAFGGSGDGGGFLGNAEIYVPGYVYWQVYGSWTLAIPRASFASAATGEGVLVIGGYSTFGTLADVEYYVPGEPGGLRAPLPTARGGLGAAAIQTPEGPRVYAVGGREAGGAAVARVDIYDPASNTWSAGPPLPAPRVGAAVAAVGGRLYVIGGLDAAGNATATTFVLDVATPAEGGPGAAGPLALAPPSPNPTTGPVRLDLRTDDAGAVVVEAFDALGRRVALLHDGPLAAGTHTLEWDGRDEAGRSVPAGVYVVRARQGAHAVVRRLTVTR